MRHLYSNEHQERGTLHFHVIITKAEDLIRLIVQGYMLSDVGNRLLECSHIRVAGDVDPDPDSQ